MTRSVTFTLSDQLPHTVSCREGDKALGTVTFTSDHDLRERLQIAGLPAEIAKDRETGPLDVLDEQLHALGIPLPSEPGK